MATRADQVEAAASLRRLDAGRLSITRTRILDAGTPLERRLLRRLSPMSRADQVEAAVLRPSGDQAALAVLDDALGRRLDPPEAHRLASDPRARALAEPARGR